MQDVINSNLIETLQDYNALVTTKNKFHKYMPGTILKVFYRHYLR